MTLWNTWYLTRSLIRLVNFISELYVWTALHRALCVRRRRVNDRTNGFIKQLGASKNRATKCRSRGISAMIFPQFPFKKITLDHLYPPNFKPDSHWTRRGHILASKKRETAERRGILMPGTYCDYGIISNHTPCGGSTLIIKTVMTHPLGSLTWAAVLVWDFCVSG